MTFKFIGGQGGAGGSVVSETSASLESRRASSALVVGQLIHDIDRQSLLFARAVNEAIALAGDGVDVTVPGATYNFVEV